MAQLISFYALDKIQNQVQDGGSEVHAAVLKAAQLSLEAIDARKKLTFLCADQNQAEAVDEYLWCHPQDRFIPHNLAGEGPENGTSVEIVWLNALEKGHIIRNTHVLINLSNTFIDDHIRFNHIIDFVPNDEQGKIAARERYKHYKMAGCQLTFNN